MTWRMLNLVSVSIAARRLRHFAVQSRVSFVRDLFVRSRFSFLFVCLWPSHSAAVRYASLPNDNDFALNSTRLDFRFPSDLRACLLIATLSVPSKFDKNLQEKWVSAGANDLEALLNPTADIINFIWELFICSYLKGVAMKEKRMSELFFLAT